MPLIHTFFSYLFLLSFLFSPHSFLPVLLIFPKGCELISHIPSLFFKNLKSISNTTQYYYFDFQVLFISTVRWMNVWLDLLILLVLLLFTLKVKLFPRSLEAIAWHIPIIHIIVGDELTTCQQVFVIVDVPFIFFKGLMLVKVESRHLRVKGFWGIGLIFLITKRIF